MYRVNTEIPGAIEFVRPNKFFTSKYFFGQLTHFVLELRPVEDFRHTPLIPISDHDLSKYKQDVEAKNRKGYYVENLQRHHLLLHSCLYHAFLMLMKADADQRTDRKV